MSVPFTIDEFLQVFADYNRVVSLQFRFDSADDVVGVYAPDRPRAVNGAYQPTPWAGRFRNHTVRNGVRIPLEGEVEWIVPTGTVLARAHRVDRVRSAALIIGRWRLPAAKPPPPAIRTHSRSAPSIVR